MLCSLRLGLIAFAASAVFPALAPATAQTFTLPELGLQASGACPQLALRERTGKTMVPVGCLDGTAKTMRWAGEGSGISVTPSASAAAGTLARSLADRASLTSPAFGGVLTNVAPNGCVSSTSGNWTGDATATWVPACTGTWMSRNVTDTLIHATRGTTSSNGVYPPSAGAGTPVSNGGANLLIQTKADGENSFQTSGAFINLDVVGGKASQDHPSDAQSPNATGILISGHQRPGPNGERAPNTWTLNADHVIGPNSGGTQSFNVEWDLSNFNADCSIGAGSSCISAWHFYGGINAYPNTAFHYFGNPHTEPYTGTATALGNTLTLSTGRFSPLMTKVSYGGQTFRVDCTTTTCVADRPIGTITTPGAFAGRGAMAHIGLFFQENDGGSQVQDHDFFMGDSARVIMTAAGNHRVGLDFTQDAMPYAALFKGGQQVCYNGAAMCMSYSGGLNAWMFAPGTDPGAATARIDAAGNIVNSGIIQAGGNISGASYNASGVAGASCSGPPTANFQVVGGIVTRC